MAITSEREEKEIEKKTAKRNRKNCIKVEKRKTKRNLKTNIKTKCVSFSQRKSPCFHACVCVCATACASLLIVTNTESNLIKIWTICSTFSAHTTFHLFCNVETASLFPIRDYANWMMSVLFEFRRMHTKTKKTHTFISSSVSVRYVEWQKWREKR